MRNEESCRNLCGISAIMQKELEDSLAKVGINANERYFWRYQYRLADEMLIPYLKKRGAFSPGNRVAEVGCAEGGVLAAFVKAGGASALGTDISTYRLGTGEKVARSLGIDIALVHHDICNDPLPKEWLGRYDLVLVRDVIEHIEDTALALRQVRELLKPGGFLFVNFPPYASPYGGHQHTLKNFWGKLPYMHLLPEPLFQKMIASGRKADIVEVKRLRNIRLSAKKFAAAAKDAGFSIVKEEYFLIRPVFKMKFGLPEVSLTKISAVPFVKEMFSLEAAYLLQPARQ